MCKYINTAHVVSTELNTQSRYIPRRGWGCVGEGALRPKMGRGVGGPRGEYSSQPEYLLGQFNPNRSIKFSQKNQKKSGYKWKFHKYYPKWVAHNEKLYPARVWLTFEYPNKGCIWGVKGGQKGGTSLLTLTEGVPPPPSPTPAPPPPGDTQRTQNRSSLWKMNQHTGWKHGASTRNST